MDNDIYVVQGHVAIAAMILPEPHVAFDPASSAGGTVSVYYAPPLPFLPPMPQAPQAPQPPLPRTYPKGDVAYVCCIVVPPYVCLNTIIMCFGRAPPLTFEMACVCVSTSQRRRRLRLHHRPHRRRRRRRSRRRRRARRPNLLQRRPRPCNLHKLCRMPPQPPAA